MVHSDLSLSYHGRQRVMASMSAWANREGPVTRSPSAPFCRDIVEIEPGSERAKSAAFIDALQTTIILSQEVPDQRGVDPARLLSMLSQALQAHPWHP